MRLSEAGRRALCLGAIVVFLGVGPAADALESPEICGLRVSPQGMVEVLAHIPRGYRHAVLEGVAKPDSAEWEAVVSGGTSGSSGTVWFRAPGSAQWGVLRVRVGTSVDVPRALHEGDEVFAVDYGLGGGTGNGEPGHGWVDEFGSDGFGSGACLLDGDPVRRIGHLLNRAAYGPSAADVGRVRSRGIEAWLAEQLATPGGPLPGDEELQALLDAEFLSFLPNDGAAFIPAVATWRYFRGVSEPPSGWKAVGFDAGSWQEGKAGFGYGDDDDATLLADMEQGEGQAGYYSVYLRREFEAPDPQGVAALILRMTYDDGFVAYLNGEEVARENLAGLPPRYNRPANEAGGNVDGDAQIEFLIADAARRLRQGTNVLAVQVHNHSLDSSDLSAHPELVSVSPAPYRALPGIESLQSIMHLRGVHSPRQLQAVLGEFWENHFTTDFEKVEEYLDELESYERLQTDGAAERRLEQQIRMEAATMEWREYDFFHANALGWFGDLLLYSATSPAMLIYLDNVLNLRGEPNENYAREILELHSMGVDNGYTQSDIEELARCFTGWTIRKMPADRVPAFPESARRPPVADSLQVREERELMGLGGGWSYKRGTSEPAPAPDGSATAAWTEPGFPLNGWAAGSTGIGYGDGDDATVLSDMRNKYVAVYMRKSFPLQIPEGYDAVELEIAYDDGYVAYWNGVEIGRSASMYGLETPPAFDATAVDLHEQDEEPDRINLDAFRDLIRPYPENNVLAIQAHNYSSDSSDLSLRPRIVARRYTDDSIQPTDPAGLWTFRFDSAEHDAGSKILFEGTAREIRIPAGRAGVEGVRDATDVIDALERHPATAEHIVLKLVQRLVSDSVSLESYRNRSADSALLEAVDNGLTAWFSTERPGHIATVLGEILDPVRGTAAFWSDATFRSKVKTPLEFLNSAVRAVGGQVRGTGLAAYSEEMGMSWFVRDDPDGYGESGPDWMHTQGLLSRVRFCQDLARDPDYAGAFWDIEAEPAGGARQTANAMLDYFDSLVFQGNLTEARRSVLLEFVNTDEAGRSSPVDELDGAEREQRLRDMIGLMLAGPEFQFQ